MSGIKEKNIKFERITFYYSKRLLKLKILILIWTIKNKVD